MDQTSHLIVAIDGFSSCGKSTLAKQLAQHFKFLYIDTGAMYRCVTLYFQQHKIDLDVRPQVEKALEEIHIRFDHKGDQQKVILNDVDVSDEIRTPQVSDLVSEVAALSVVRKKMVLQQKSYAKDSNLIMDGRDIGTVVYPHAQLKIFLTASELIRAKRRLKELLEKGIEITLEEVMMNIHKRDFIDSTREDSPLTQAEDAIVIDNTDLTEEEQFDKVCQMIEGLL